MIDPSPASATGGFVGLSDPPRVRLLRLCSTRPGFDRGTRHVMAKADRASAPFELQHLVDAVRNHALYGHVTDDRSLRELMRKHVFAVWDFQSLLKALHTRYLFRPNDGQGAPNSWASGRPGSSWLPREVWATRLGSFDGASGSRSRSVRCVRRSRPEIGCHRALAPKLKASTERNRSRFDWNSG